MYRGKLKNEWPDAVVFSFNPWIVSGGDDLIATFFRAFLREIQSHPDTPSDKIKELSIAALSMVQHFSDQVAQYGGTPSFIAKFVSAIVGLVRTRSNTDTPPLHASRENLRRLLEELRFPIVILMDELDRISNAEISRNDSACSRRRRLSQRFLPSCI